MKSNSYAVVASIFMLSFIPSNAHAQSPLTGPVLRLEGRGNAYELVVERVTNAGALFLHRAADLQSLASYPSLVLQTNTPMMDDLKLPISSVGGFSNQAFFSAVHWPGRSVEEFGDPENYTDIPPPSMILITSGAPTNLASGQIFTVDFFVTAPTTPVGWILASGLQPWPDPAGQSHP